MQMQMQMHCRFSWSGHPLSNQITGTPTRSGGAPRGTSQAVQGARNQCRNRCLAAAGQRRSPLRPRRRTQYWYCVCRRLAFATTLEVLPTSRKVSVCLLSLWLLRCPSPCLETFRLVGMGTTAEGVFASETARLTLHLRGRTDSCLGALVLCPTNPFPSLPLAGPEWCKANCPFRLRPPPLQPRLLWESDCCSSRCLNRPDLVGQAVKLPGTGKAAPVPVAPDEGPLCHTVQLPGPGLEPGPGPGTLDERFARMLFSSHPRASGRPPRPSMAGPVQVELILFSRSLVCPPPRPAS